MYTEFSSFSFMGASNSDIFLSEKDLEDMEFNFLVRPTLEFPNGCDQFTPSEDSELRQKQEGEEQAKEVKEEKCEINLVSSLELIKIPSLGEFKVDEYDEDDTADGCRTPTCLDQRIPLIPHCPPAPRKPKSLPSTKRKTARRQILLDLSNEIESLFPAALLSDLGNKIKKVRKGSCTE